LVATIWLENTSWITAAIHAIGSILAAAISHRIYVRHAFVERGDPAVAWLTIAWLLIFIPNESHAVAIKSWTAILLLQCAIDHVLQVHRQHSTSGIQFRSGTLASLSFFLEPMHIGVIIGMVVIQIIARPFAFREWAMLFIGLIWGAIIVRWIGYFFPALLENHSETTLQWLSHSEHLLSPEFAHWGLLGLCLWGVLLLARENSRLSLRSKTTRMHLFIFFFFIVICAIWVSLASSPFGGSSTFPSSLATHARDFNKIIAIAAGFATVGLIPTLKRNRGQLSRWGVLQLAILIVSMLILFIPSF
jgi:hypothetical protein